MCVHSCEHNERATRACPATTRADARFMRPPRARPPALRCREPPGARACRRAPALSHGPAQANVTLRSAVTSQLRGHFRPRPFLPLPLRRRNDVPAPSPTTDRAKHSLPAMSRVSDGGGRGRGRGGGGDSRMTIIRDSGIMMVYHHFSLVANGTIG